MSARYAKCQKIQMLDISLFGSGAMDGFCDEIPNSSNFSHLAHCISPKQEGVKTVNVSFDFINQVLLDKRLSVASFKLWYFLKERSDAEGKSFHGHRSISAITGIRQQSILKYINELVEHGYLKVEHRKKTSNLYTLITPNFSVCKSHTGCVQNAHADVCANRTHSTLNLSSTLNLKQTPIPPLNTKTQPLLIPESQVVCDMAEKIYQEYPRKVGKPVALKAIRKAMQSFDAEKLLELTKDYADARKDEEIRFTPHPSKWFNQEMFNDDPSTWKSKGNHPKTLRQEEREEQKQKNREEWLKKWCANAPDAINENR